jgi:plastocyanin
MKYVLIVAIVALFAGLWFYQGTGSRVPNTETIEDTSSNPAPDVSAPVDGAMTSTDVVDSTDGAGMDSTDAVNLEDGTASSVQTLTIDSFKYGYSETELRVREGDTVTVVLTSSDGLHDWVVDELNVRTDKIQAGERTEVTFVATKAGTYEFYCSVGDHRALGMVGKLVVEG